jgi:hypothetical protein
MTEEAKISWGKLFDDCEKDCVELELVASVATIKKMRRQLAQPNCTWGEYGALAEELYHRLFDEMRGRFFWSLSIRETEYYIRPWNGWEKIISRFPDTLEKVEEASKCFALSRYAAAVFHSLQVIEVGLIELGTFMDVKDPLSGWTAVSNRLNSIMGKKYNERTDFERQNFEFLEQVQGTVEALKNAWRNKISHAQGKLVLMTTDFTPEIAEEIIFATRAFMRRLAEGLPSPA